MPMRFRTLAVSLVAAAVLATPALAQEKPADNADRPELTKRIQRQDRATVHQPEPGTEAARRSERQRARDGARQAARRSNDGARGSRGQRARDTNASRVRSSTRQRARVHRPDAR
jgi:hypothetical protein